MRYNGLAQNGSFVQDQRHLSKTETFQAVQPSMLAEVMSSFGFDLVHLKTGRARLADRAAHQTTLARYRSRDAFGVNGSFYDILIKVPHLYGAIEARAGFFRGVCANQWNSGDLFDRIKVRHVGDPVSELNSLIPKLVSQREAFVDLIKSMQAKDVSPSQLVQLSKDIAHLRLADNKSIVKNVQYENLLKVRRSEDNASDLFTVINVIQENVMRHGIKYQVETTDQNGIAYLRNQVARPVMRTRQGEIETVRSMELNGSIWDIATKLLQNEKAAA